MAMAIHDWLRRFGLDEFLHHEVAGVIGTLPGHVRDDFVDDPAFILFDYEPRPGLAMHVPVGLPRRRGGGGASRSVVLKRTLALRPLSFVRYVIAHELAHAHLRNQEPFPRVDPEHAVDAMAEEWGLPRTY